MQKFYFLVISFFTTAYFSFAQYNSVSLYEQCNYGGKKHSLGPGNYRGYAMKVDNDKLASFKIPNGMKLTLYEHDKFEGRSITYTSNMNCLPAEWIYNTSSMVVESEYGNNNTYNNDYVTFFNDCYSKGYSQSLKPGTYTSSQLGLLSRNISSFSIHGNLRVKVYLNNDNLSGYSIMHETSVNCLANNQNDRIASLVIDYKPYRQSSNTNNYGNNYATIYSDCYYGGNSMRLEPGYYQGNKLGLFRNNISSIEMPNNLRAKVYLNNEFSGSHYTISENINCLSSTLNNKISSVIIEEVNNNSYNPYNPNYSTSVFQKVELYTDANYKGQYISVLPGTYPSMSMIGFIDDALSSLTVPQGFRVVLYEHENFSGKSYTVTASKSSFNFTNWNDRASSIAIYRD